MAEQQTALATVDPEESKKRELTVAMEAIIAENVQDIASLDGGKLTRWAVRMPVYPIHQYAIKGAGVPPDDVPDAEKRYWPPREGYAQGFPKWGAEWSVNLKADGYDWLNRVGLVSFHTPDYVHDRDGKWVPNPIHGHDYLYHREIGLSYAETGQMVMFVEDIEIDFQQAWQAERLRRLSRLLNPPKKRRRGQQDEDESEEAPVSTLSTAEEEALLVRDENGVPRLGQNGELQFTLPIRLEAEAAERLLKLREYGGRQAKTIAQRRILARATGIKTLWQGVMVDRPTLITRYVMVVGWRDQMTPEERFAKAKEESKAVFGAQVRERPQEVTPEEFDQVDEVIEGQVVQEEANEAPVEVTGDIKAAAKAGKIAGVTVGMPGEKVAGTLCQALPDGESDPKAACTKKAGHEPEPHESAWGVWPSVVR